MNNNQYSHGSDPTQFVVSYELLCLLRWLVEHDYEKLKKIIAKSLLGGLKEELNKIEHKKPGKCPESDMHEIQNSIIDFFTLLEAALIETLNDYAIQKVVEKKLMPAIEHIDTTVCDDATVKSSIEHASTKIEHSTIDSAQEVLFKELLRRWKPAKKQALN